MDKETQLGQFLNKDDKITKWPSKEKKRIIVLEYLISKFSTDHDYTEKEVNYVLNQHHTFGDPALLRRELYDRGYFNRDADGSSYRRVIAKSE